MKKILCLVLVLVIGLCGACFSASADIIDVALYQDWNFYGRSDPEYIGLQVDADSVSFYAQCESTPDEPELLSCYIIGYTNPSFSYSFEFYADESVTTYAYAFPSGLYKIYFVGSTDLKKTHAYTIFTKVD